MVSDADEPAKWAPYLDVHRALMVRVEADSKAFSMDLGELEFRDAPFLKLSNAHISFSRTGVERLLKEIKERKG